MVTQIELEFRAQGGGRSQNERLRDYFVAHPREWVPMPELAKVITPTGIGAAVHSRVADLRSKFSMDVEQRTEREAGTRRTLSFYRYNPPLNAAS